METDVLIIGSGIAGLSLAIKLNQLRSDLKIHIVTKADAFESNTRYAQGGIAAVMGKLNDSFENHIRDTLNCGKGLCDEQVVKMVVEQAPERIKELIDLGIAFDTDNNKHLELGLEGGHSHPRIVHTKDKTGYEIETILLEHVQRCETIYLNDHVLVADLATTKKNGKICCTGAIIYDGLSGELNTLNAAITVLASGGCGQVFLNTTNPAIATGDGYAMAQRAGAQLKNMRFMQFHPTALYQGPNQPVSFLLSEALRGFGAHIVDIEEKRFLFSYDDRGELATRDVISAAIFKHLETTQQPYVYLDLRHLDCETCTEAFPTIISELKQLNYNIPYDLIPIVPSAHYQCGGVLVNQEGQTSIPGLYALGEVSCTGLHGANRLASNSLLEALVYAHNAAESIHEKLDSNRQTNVYPKALFRSVKALSNKPFDKQIIRIKKLMTATAFSTTVEEMILTLKHIKQVLAIVEEEIFHVQYSEKILQLRNIAQTAQLVMADRIKFLQIEQDKQIPLTKQFKL